ncbi:extensin-1-like [Selaginella moellendorffii]|uniref:extensin-1-like n=1 Tax=Selaginella moellendorffii TaxID=88036 RepID=UPI000D1CC9EA|nr:extensin-1-like [Selaginella moellendorffii]|eukprot:XP_024522146.1 extensin-1-like [Selaginella moellendorffii]
MEKLPLLLLVAMVVLAAVALPVLGQEVEAEPEAFDPNDDFEFQMKKPKILVKGHVVCDRCWHGRVGNMSLPLHDAEVGIKCVDLYGFVTFSGVGYTNTHGVFTIPMDEIPAIFGVKGCKAKLLRGPSTGDCDEVSSMGDGHTGAPLLLVHKSLREVVFTSGPFACRPLKRPGACKTAAAPPLPPPPVYKYSSPPPPFKHVPNHHPPPPSVPSYHSHTPPPVSHHPPPPSLRPVAPPVSKSPFNPYIYKSPPPPPPPAPVKYHHPPPAPIHFRKTPPPQIHPSPPPVTSHKYPPPMAPQKPLPPPPVASHKYPPPMAPKKPSPPPSSKPPPPKSSPGPVTKLPPPLFYHSPPPPPTYHNRSPPPVPAKSPVQVPPPHAYKYSSPPPPPRSITWDFGVKRGKLAIDASELPEEDIND